MGWFTGQDKGTKARAEPGGRREVVKCRACNQGTCRCKMIARKDNKAAARNKAPHVCGRHLRSGGTCHRTVAHGQSCSNSGH